MPTGEHRSTPPSRFPRQAPGSASCSRRCSWHAAADRPRHEPRRQPSRPDVGPCLIAATVIHASSANADIVTPISSDRQVSVLNRDTNPQTAASVTGPAFGPWQATAYAINDSSNPNFNGDGSAVAVTSQQQSAFSASGISFSGFVFIDYTVGLVPDLGCMGTNRCDATFHVDGTCPYQFQCAFSGRTSATRPAERFRC